MTTSSINAKIIIWIIIMYWKVPQMCFNVPLEDTDSENILFLIYTKKRSGFLQQYFVRVWITLMIVSLFLEGGAFFVSALFCCHLFVLCLFVCFLAISDNVKVLATAQHLLCSWYHFKGPRFIFFCAWVNKNIIFFFIILALWLWSRSVCWQEQLRYIKMVYL